MNSYLLRTSRSRKGYSLVEVVIAALLLAIGVTASFSVCLMTKYKMNKDKTRSRMQMYARQVMEDLKSYVTADTAVTAGAPPYNPGVDPTATWKYRYDYSTSCNAWALTAKTEIAGCYHDVTSILPDDLKNPLPGGAGATLKYTVTVENGLRRVDVVMTWNTPD